VGFEDAGFYSYVEAGAPFTELGPMSERRRFRVAQPPGRDGTHVEWMSSNEVAFDATDLNTWTSSTAGRIVRLRSNTSRAPSIQT
jgi:hypothetical protein